MSTASREAVARMWRRRSLMLFGIAVLFLAPSLPFAPGPLQLSLAATSALVGLSMNVLAGYAGQISLAQAALFGSGAFAIGRLLGAGVPWPLAFLAAGFVASIAALLIGFPALRIRGLHLAIATLGFQFMMQRVIFRMEWLGGAAGVDVRGPVITTGSRFFDISSDAGTKHFLYVILAVLVVILFLDHNLTSSRAGRAMFALRQDEQVAASFGIPVARYKLLAFAISGFYAGLAGALFGTLITTVTNESFDYLYSIEFLVFAVLGGLGSRAGTAVGGAFPTILRRVLENLAFTGALIGGLLTTFTLLRYPGGLAEQGREVTHIARTLMTRGVKWLGAFAGVIAASVGIAVVLPVILDVPVRGIARALGTGYSLTAFPRILIGLIGLAVSFQIGVRLIIRMSGGATHASPAATGGDDHEQVEAAVRPPAISVRASFARAGTRSSYRGPLLKVDDVSIRFGGVRALDGVSMEVREGELIGIMGPNGSGKTTLLNNISGFLAPNSGDISFRGRSILKAAPHERAALGLGRTFQGVGLVKNETVFDNFLIAQHLVCRYGPLEGIARTGGVLAEERRLHQRARLAIGMLGLDDIAGAKVASLPHGRAKLVELGCALVTGPELLLLDEPAAGVSPQEADALGETLKSIASNFGVTILMIEHHVPLMLSTCDYIYVLNFGQMLTHGEPEEVAGHPDVIAAYLGSAGKEAAVVTAGSR